MMRRFAAVFLPLCLAAFLMGGSVANAQNVHFKGGKNAGPTFTDLGTTLRTCLSLAGLGEGDVTIIVEVEGSVTATCVNPGGNEAPGQNKVPIVVEASDTIPADAIKNGNLSICLTTAAPDEPSAQEAGCPNGNWTTRLNTVDFDSAVITVIQGGQVVLQQAFFL